MKKNKKILWLVLLIIGILLLIISSAVITITFMGHNYTRDELMSSTSESSDSETMTDSAGQKLVDNPIDFKALNKINKDIYAWITIPDTNIDYAVAQSGEDKDDFFYLSHNLEGNYEFAGTIYSEKKNSKNFSDPVTVLYGHNMLNGTMFADLHKFEDSTFFKKHKFFYVYTKGHKFTYKVYSAYEYDDRHILNSFDFTKKADIEEYFSSSLEPVSMVKNVRKNASLTVDDKVLTLSTCTNNNDSARYLVQGVLIKNESTK